MTVRVAFIGTGGIARAHLNNLVNIEGAEVVALCDLKQEQVESAIDAVNENAEDKEFQPAPYTELGKMLTAENPDGVYICLPPFAHGEAEEAVLKAGCGMFVEKPVALDLGQAVDIAGEIEKRGIVTAVGYQLRYSNLADRVKELLADRTVAQVMGSRCGGVPGVWWWTLQDKSGGMLVEQATHEVDLLRFFIGEVERVYAEADRRRYTEEEDFDIFDVNCMTVRFACGAVGNFANSCICSYGAPEGSRGLNILTSDMALTYTHGALWVKREGEEPEKYEAQGSPMLSEDRAFIRALETGDTSQIRSSYSDGVRTLAVTLAAEHSARSGNKVELSDFMAAEGLEIW